MHDQVEEMLKVIKASSVDELIDQTIPASIRLKKDAIPASGQIRISVFAGF